MKILLLIYFFFHLINGQTDSPTIEPTYVPTSDPTLEPTVEPTYQPTGNTGSPTDATSAPSFDPTETPTYNPTTAMPTYNDNNTPAPTMKPTEAPTDPETDSPTPAPTYDFPPGKGWGWRCIIKFTPWGIDKFNDIKDLMIAIMYDSLGIKDTDDNEIDVESLEEDGDTLICTWRIYAEDSFDIATIMAAFYKASDDVTTTSMPEMETTSIFDDMASTDFLATVARRRLLQDDDLSAFDEAFMEAFAEVEPSIIVSPSEVESLGEVDGDEFLDIEDPTFGELIASPFILLGIVMTIVGIVWLLFLRSNIPNKYPSYINAQNNGNAGDVEMTQR